MGLNIHPVERVIAIDGRSWIVLLFKCNISKISCQWSGSGPMVQHYLGISYKPVIFAMKVHELPCSNFGHGSSWNIVAKMIRLYRPSNRMFSFKRHSSSSSVGGPADIPAHRVKPTRRYSAEAAGMVQHCSTIGVVRWGNYMGVVLWAVLNYWVCADYPCALGANYKIHNCEMSPHTMYRRFSSSTGNPQLLVLSLWNIYVAEARRHRNCVRCSSRALFFRCRISSLALRTLTRISSSFYMKIIRKHDEQVSIYK